MSKSSRGFTIIELMTVITVIAILVSTIIIDVMKYASESKDVTVKADMKELTVAAADYLNNNDGNSSQFCTSENGKKVADAIAKINPNYQFHCLDPVAIYPGIDTSSSSSTDTTSSGSSPSSDVSTMLDTAYQGNCTYGKWFALAMGLKTDTTCWCVDSQGASGDSCGDLSSCSCNIPTQDQSQGQGGN